MRIYLDSCCLNRPVDHGGQVRIALEGQAVSAILNLCESGKWTLLNSSALEFEAARTKDEPRRWWLEEVLKLAGETVAMESAIVARASELESRGFKNIDALHVASAEAARADCVCTCDDRLLRLARRQSDLRVRVLSPFEVVQEFNL